MQKEPLLVHGVLANLFVFYVIIVNNLNDIYDQTVQYQKRAFLKKLLESITTRLLEIKQKLHLIELSDIIYVDSALVNNKFIPQQIELSHPYYFLYNRAQEIQNIINEFRINRKMNGSQSDRERYRDLSMNSSDKENHTSDGIKVVRSNNDKIENQDYAATIIQKNWHRYTTRKNIWKKQFDAACLLNLAEYCNKNKSVIDAINIVKEIKRSKKLEITSNFVLLCQEEKENILKKNAVKIKFDIGDFIRNWFKEM